MKLIRLFFTFFIATGILVTIESCERVHGCTDPIAINYNGNASVDNGTCTYPATFYFDENGANATVNVSNKTGIVSANYQNGAPTCGLTAAGCANFSLPLGVYNYTANSATTSWTGQVEIDRGCATVLLTQSTGSVTFFTTTDYGNITITINGTTAQYSGYFNGTPQCGASGAATFDLPVGTYAYSATNNNGTTWGPTTITVNADQCYPIQLQ